jgi:hypothetical protein
MAEVEVQAFHEGLSAEGTAFQHAVVQKALTKVRQLPPFEGVEGDRMISFRCLTFQITQTGPAREDYETLVLGRFIEQYQEGMLVVAWFAMSPEGLMAGGTDDDIIVAIHEAVKEAADEDEHITLGETNGGATPINHAHSHDDIVPDVNSFLSKLFDGLGDKKENEK